MKHLTLIVIIMATLIVILGTYSFARQNIFSVPQWTSREASARLPHESQPKAAPAGTDQFMVSGPVYNISSQK